MYVKFFSDGGDKTPLRPVKSILRKHKTKREPRKLFTTRQLMELEKKFCQKQYISISEITEFSSSINVTERRIRNWFQNRRAKAKLLQESQQLESTRTISSPLISRNSCLYPGLSPPTVLRSNNIPQPLPGYQFPQSMLPSTLIPQLYGIPQFLPQMDIAEVYPAVSKHSVDSQTPNTNIPTKDMCSCNLYSMKY